MYCSGKNNSGKKNTNSSGKNHCLTTAFHVGERIVDHNFEAIGIILPGAASIGAVDKL